MWSPGSGAAASELDRRRVPAAARSHHVARCLCSQLMTKGAKASGARCRQATARCRQATRPLSSRPLQIAHTTSLNRPVARRAWEPVRAVQAGCAAAELRGAFFGGCSECAWLAPKVRATSGAHEIKADGYRAQVHVVEGEVIVYSRRGHDWTDQFGAIAQARPGACLLQSACRASRRYRLRPYTTNATLTKRPGRLFIDYLRNGRGTTAIGTYSPRARPGFPIAAPVTWKQLQRGIRPDAFHMFSPFVSKDCDRCPRCCPRIEFNEAQFLSH
jgi:hypothetical protein